MIPPEWQLRVPEGIDDNTTRALTTLIEERLGGVPIERVLVWHTDSVVEGALAHLAGLFDVDMVAHGVDETRVLLEQAIERLIRRGTPSAVEETLEALGLTGALVEEDTTVLHDGSILRDGTHVHGWDSHWAVFWLAVEGTMAAVSYRTIVEQTDRTKRRSAHLGAIYAFAELGGVTALATEDGYLIGATGQAVAIDAERNFLVATEDGYALATEDGYALASLGAPVLIGWHRSGVSLKSLAAEDSSVIVADDGWRIGMLEAS